MKKIISVLIMLAFGNIISAQDASAYEKSNKGDLKLFNKENLTVNQSLNFGMSSSLQNSDLKSQSLYTMMLQYEFSQPVTVNLNFGLPIHSTYSNNIGLSADNIESRDYFRNIPFDALLTWQPHDNFIMQLRFARNTPASYYSNMFSSYSHDRYGTTNSIFSEMRARSNNKNEKDR